MHRSAARPSCFFHGLPGLGLIACLALLAACGPRLSALEQIRARGELRVAMLNEPTSYYLGSHGNQGYEFRLAQAFAARLNVQLVIVPARDAPALRAQLIAGNADIAAAQLTTDDRWLRVALPSRSYRTVNQLVIQRRGSKRGSTVEALRAARVAIRSDSPQSVILQQLRGGGAPFLSWTELARETAEPLDWVASDDADFTVMDETEFRYARYLSPETRAAFALPHGRELQWMIRRGAPELRDAVNAFFADARRSGELQRLEQETNAELQDFEILEAQRYHKDIEELLPALRGHFEAAAADTGLDWRLLAAVGYQESRWVPTAKSGAGAAGLMMLTQNTAESLGVTDRLDPAQSILGGARYLQQTIERLPPRIRNPDRLYLAFAAYNIGYGHLEDARVITQSRGMNPDLWTDVAANLPLLAEPRYYLSAKRGYARGWEPVRYVEQVRDFLTVLEWSGTDTDSAAAVTPASAPAPRRAGTR